MRTAWTRLAPLLGAAPPAAPACTRRAPPPFTTHVRSNTCELSPSLIRSHCCRFGCRLTRLTWWLTAARCVGVARRAAPQTGSPVTAATAGCTSAATSARALARLMTTPTQSSRAATPAPTARGARRAWRRKQLAVGRWRGSRRWQQRQLQQQRRRHSRSRSRWRRETAWGLLLCVCMSARLRLSL